MCFSSLFVWTSVKARHSGVGQTDADQTIQPGLLDKEDLSLLPSGQVVWFLCGVKVFLHGLKNTTNRSIF